MIRLGTRRSPLAVAQARHVAALLDDEVELIELTTLGDRERAAPDKAKWVRELERALLEDRVDLVVHSAKDVPGELPAELDLLGAPERAAPRDALVGAASLDELPPGAVVGTASLRRAAQLRAYRSDLEVLALRGNVDTRLRKLEDGEARALVLARAGLDRLELSGRVGAELDHALFVPAAGQGTLALEGRRQDSRVRDAAAAITHGPTWDALRAERAAMAELGADCTSACGAHAVVERALAAGRGAPPGENAGGAPAGAGARADGATPAGAAVPAGGGEPEVGARIRIALFAGTPDGARWVRDAHEGPAADPEAVGRDAARRLARAGAAEILAVEQEPAGADGTPTDGGAA